MKPSILPKNFGGKTEKLVESLDFSGEIAYNSRERRGRIPRCGDTGRRTPPYFRSTVNLILVGDCETSKIIGAFPCLPLWGRGTIRRTIRRMVDEENGLKKTFRYADTRKGGESGLPSRKAGLHMFSSSTAIAVPLLQRRRRNRRKLLL